MSLPPVTIVCPDVAQNALGRCLLVAELLASETEVRIVGAQLGERLWAPAANSSIPIEGLRLHRLDQLARGIPWLRAQTRGRLVIVHKPQPTSMGWYLAARGGPGRALLDIDDWDAGFAKGWPTRSRDRLRRASYLARRAINPRLINSEVGTTLLEPAARLFRQRIVSNRWLQRRFGGALLYHVRDPSHLDPSRTDLEEARARLDLTSTRSWVGFVGTLRPHKGVQDLVQALAGCGPEGPGLALLGGRDPRDDFARELLVEARERLGPSRLRSCEPFPFERLPQHLAALDLVALPSRDLPAARGQIPAKLFDAMAMAKPVVVTGVNDMPYVLGPGGRVVPPQDPDALRSAILSILEAPERGLALGAAGRARLIQHFSYAAGRRVLREAVLAAWRGERAQ